MKLKIQNSPEELLSFPINQSVTLVSDTEIETATLQKNIVLIRGIDDQGALRASDIYNQNIGFVKNHYDVVDTSIETYAIDDEWFIKITPIKPLPPASKFLLYVDKGLSSEYILVYKAVSKGPSDLKLVVAGDIPEDKEYILKVASQPHITNKANIVKFQLYDSDTYVKDFLVDAKKGQSLTINKDLVLEVLDVAYAMGEEFHILHQTREGLREPLICAFATSISADVQALEHVEPSSAISYDDVLDFYEGLDEPKTLDIDFRKPYWENDEFRVTPFDDGFLITLNKLTSDMIDWDQMKYRHLPAFNRMDLRAICLFDPSKQWILKPEIWDDKNVFIAFEQEGIMKSEWASDIDMGIVLGGDGS